MREARRAKRRAGAPDGLADRREVPPETAAEGREAAWRTALRAERELGPEALAAVRRFFLDAGSGTAREAAEESGISPSTMTRALQRLRSIAADELRGSEDGVLPAFSRALFEILGSR
jgi:DNA invertase Pin-like site-specific DNA recombinase